MHTLSVTLLVMAVESAEPGVAVMTLSFLLIGCCSSHVTLSFPDKMLQSTIIGTLWLVTPLMDRPVGPAAQSSPLLIVQHFADSPKQSVDLGTPC